ncbi:glycosyltransferase [Peribacillus huizhouensis]|uniref:Glycosyltransferase involved in cell wall biosynthesis n=1 Tax=Peribacillus huizhouensis TaxID=1501239 RepID=A0ABR6CKS5_9BACI|nr:glycosyltransferase [Peribacillus huizhouensis]MBA9025654.1 glycosyltransferase involved in cell wall biosynthesis [Peribacillus huizhouensis]
MNLLVSINCITYNHEEYIADAIESFLMQKTNFDFEILIGEDCSSDKTKKIVEEYMQKYPNKIRLITSDKNVGARKNVLRLIENSRGKYIAQCEGDDYWTDSYKLQKQVDYMESHPECSLCFHAVKIVNVNGKPTGEEVRPYTRSDISPIEEIISRTTFCPTASILYPKKLMENPSDFFMNAHVGDYALQMMLTSQGYAYYIDKIMSAYRIGGKGSWTSQLNSGENVTEKYIRVKQGDIKLLEEFNRYSINKYFTVIEKTKMKREFEILVLKNKIKEIKKSKYKVYYDEISIKEKSKINSKYYFPKLYSKIVDIKGYIDGYKNNKLKK